MSTILKCATTSATVKQSSMEGNPTTFEVDETGLTIHGRFMPGWRRQSDGRLAHPWRRSIGRAEAIELRDALNAVFPVE